MKQRFQNGKRLMVALLIGVLGGCASAPPAPREAPDPSPAGASTPVIATLPPIHSTTDWVPPLFTSSREKAAYYVSRLADPRFITTTQLGDQLVTRFIAAERLGEIGLEAIPLVVSRLESDDEYEVMLALYALQLASQDSAVLARTGGEAVQLPTPLDSRANAANLAVAKPWWQRHEAALEAR